MDRIKNLKDYENKAAEARKKILKLIYMTTSPHIGPSFSCVDLLIALYFKVLRVDPKMALNFFRDRLVFSKGHACPALYAVLALRGFLKDCDLEGFATDYGSLEQHPNIDQKRGIEFSTGSLGHGLSVGTGMALAAKKDNKKYRIFVLLSDGELNEGSTWEAIMFAAQHKLDNLVAVVDYNKMQALGFTKDTIDLEPLGKKWADFGWSVKEIDGHDFMGIFDAFQKIPFLKNKPSVVIAHTIKGKGVSFMENDLLWHYRAPDKYEYNKALEELT